MPTFASRSPGRRRAIRLFGALLATILHASAQAQAQAADQSSPAFEFKDVSGKSLIVSDRGQQVLVYNYGEIPFQAGGRTRTRAAYFHPIYGLDGEMLTDNAPADHFHHHGLFWAWTHVQVAGKEYNFWEGDDVRIRFERWLDKETSDDGAKLAVQNGWFIGDRRVMDEQLRLAVQPVSADGRNIDVTLTWTPTEAPITLTGAADKSYGGFSLRFAPRRDTVVTVPHGRSAEDLLITKLPWADLSARFRGATGTSGAAIFVHPSHPDFPPEWMTREYGLLAVGWPGVTSKTIAAGQAVTCRYRLWIHRGMPDAATVQAAYDQYRNSDDRER